jgi:hypothetical protein
VERQHDALGVAGRRSGAGDVQRSTRDRDVIALGEGVAEAAVGVGHGPKMSDGKRPENWSS